MKIDWKSKLSSRKFWALLAALIIAVISLFGIDAGQTEKIVSILSAVGACAVYICAESSVDTARQSGTDEKNSPFKNT